ncbi:myosin heavy chain [Trypanosoma theileri]|uniref:Myosin heavy chain n=1 Tax=Trypanosoma theileri TaxID=67003 RepID=A0A1X0NZ71_9TRYP|nr:myosin heavy chain [Trypanosoma theileri]ORC89982.1 myosin heavy chain [Trypanosoma theileri]
MTDISLQSNNGYHVGDTIYFKHPTESWIRGSLTTIKRVSKKDGFTRVVYGCSSLLQECYMGDLLNDPSLLHVYPLQEEDIHHILESCKEPTAFNTLNDLLDLAYLHDATLLEQVRVRYYENLIYTHIGPIMLALNPYDFTLPNYTEDKMPKYIAEGSSVIEGRSQNLPHAWTVAHYSYWRMCSDNYNQSIIVSGESGAGKTETAKIVVKYIGAVSTTQCSLKEKASIEEMTKKVRLTSPILEAFGNAKTRRNDNSSRFGKFMKVFFKPSPNGAVVTGSLINVYLLERSRVVTHGFDERGYHSFYQLLARDNSTEKQQRLDQLQLNSAENYQCTSIGGATIIEGVNDANDFNDVMQAMRFVGMSTTDIDQVWNTVGVVLHLLSLKFKTVTDDECCIDMTEKDAKLHIQMVKELLGLSDDIFFKELTTTTHLTRGETIIRKLRQSQALDLCEGVAKALYESLFLWLVGRINELIKPPQVSNQSLVSWIGLLDIFGFENFSHGNSFEQLCINLANETLQNHYNSVVFTRDMDECRKEGINTENVVFYDNQPCLDLICGLDFSSCGPNGGSKITNKMSILHLLDEESVLAKGNDLSFREKICDLYGGRLLDGKGGHSNFLRVKTDRSSFIIKHYAGDVIYNVDGFRAKNSDTTKESLKDAIRSSTIPFIASLLNQKSSETVMSVKYTVGSFFKNQLIQLMNEINGTHPHWIRCIKPHSSKKPHMFNGNEVMVQMRSAGVLETVKIRQNSFSVRLPFVDFVKAHRVILTSISPIIASLGHFDEYDVKKFQTSFPLNLFDREAALEIMRRTGVHSFNQGQVGKTKVFLKANVSQHLSSIVRAIQRGCILTIQTALCQYRSRREVHIRHLRLQLRIITATIYALHSQHEMRQRELHQKERYLLQTFRGILLLQNNELEERNLLEKEQHDAFSVIQEMSVKDHADIHERWFKQKQKEYQAKREALEDAENSSRSLFLTDEAISRGLLRELMGFNISEKDGRDDIELEEAMERKTSLGNAYEVFLLRLKQWFLQKVEEERLKLVDLEMEYRKKVQRYEHHNLCCILAFIDLFLEELSSRTSIIREEECCFEEYADTWAKEWTEVEKHWWTRKSIIDRRALLLLQRTEAEVRLGTESAYNKSLTALIEALVENERVARQRENERLELEEEERMLLVEESLAREREEERQRNDAVRKAAQMLWQNMLEDQRLVKEVKRMEEHINKIRMAQAQLTREYTLLCRRREIAQRKSGPVVKNAIEMKELEEYRQKQKNLSHSLLTAQQKLLEMQDKIMTFRYSNRLESLTHKEPSEIQCNELPALQEDVSLLSLRRMSVSEEGSMNLIHRMNITTGMAHSWARESSVSSSTISAFNRLQVYRRSRDQQKRLNLQMMTDTTPKSQKQDSKSRLPTDYCEMTKNNFIERNPFKSDWSPGVPDRYGTYWVYTPNGDRVPLVPFEKNQQEDIKSIHVVDSDEQVYRSSPEPNIPTFHS